MRIPMAVLAASLWSAAPALAQDGDNAEGFERSVDARNALSVVSTQSEGIAPSMVGTLPLGPAELFARAGILWYDLEIESGNTAVADDSDRDPIFGAGIGVTIAERVNLRAEYEVVEIDQLDESHAVWLTAAWRF